MDSGISSFIIVSELLQLCYIVKNWALIHPTPFKGTFPVQLPKFLAERWHYVAESMDSRVERSMSGI